MGMSRRVYIGLFAVLAELVAVAASGNQGVTNFVNDHMATSPLGDLFLRSLPSFPWRITTENRPGATTLLVAQYAAIATFFVLTFLLLLIIVRGEPTFSGPFFGELKQAVRVTSIEHPEAALMTPDQSFFLRENVKLRLLNARLSLLSRQFDLAQADLQQAQAALDRYFDHSSRRVVAVSDLLRQVGTQARQVSFPRPDDTLAAIAAAVAGH